MSTAGLEDAPRVHAGVLYLTVFVVATSGLVYELLAGTLASYVLGDSVFQFSTTIGTYLFAMGIGSFLSRYVRDDVAERFLQIELGAALAGGLSAPLLFLGFAYADFFAVVLYGMVILIGILVGLEVPLLMRILKERLELGELVARVLTVDYIGALVGSVLFAVVLVPELARRALKPVDGAALRGQDGGEEGGGDEGRGRGGPAREGGKKSVGE